VISCIFVFKPAGIAGLRTKAKFMEQKAKHGMTLKRSSDTSYLPVAWVYREVIEEAIENKTSGKIFYFCQENKIYKTSNNILQLKKINKKKLFVVLSKGIKIKINHIITLFNKPNATYNKYNTYTN